LEFVKSIVSGNDIGITVDFHEHDGLARAINQLAASKTRIAEMSRRSHRCFEEHFNWHAVSREMYAKLGVAVAGKVSAPRAAVDFAWIEHSREMRKRQDEDLALYSDAEMKRLSQEVHYLRSEFTSETGRLLKEVEFLRSEFASETARLTREIARYSKASAGQLFLLCIRAPFIILVRSPRTKAFLVTMIRSLPMPIQSLLRSIKSGFRSRFKGA
jgi:hypothetical protein